MSGKKAEFATIALITLGTYVFLYYFRSIDDNTLTSWRWVFADGGAGRVLPPILAALAAAYGVARVSLPGPMARHKGAVLFLGCFLVGAVFWREPEVIIDASRYFVQAKHLELFGAGSFLAEWGRNIPAWTDLPLVPFLYGLVFRLFGESRLFIQLLTTALFAGTAVLTYKIGRELWGEEVGLWAGWLLLGIPYLLTQVPLMLVDVPAMFFLALAVFVFLRAVERGGTAMAALSALTLSLALLSKYSIWPLSSIFVVILFVEVRDAHGRAEARVRLARGAAVAASTLIVMGAFLWWKQDVFLAQIELLRGFQLTGLDRWGEGPASTFMFQTSPLLTAAALSALPVAAARRDRKFAFVVWPVVVLLVLLDVRRIRYIIPILPFITLMAAYSLQVIGDRDVRKFVVALVLFPSLAVAVLGYLPFLEGTSASNLKRAGEHLDDIGARRVEVFILPTRREVVNPTVALPLLDLYTRAAMAYRPGKITAPPAGEVERSSLRFTWEVPFTDLYAAERPGEPVDAVVVIRGEEPPSVLPDEVAVRIEGFAGHRIFASNRDPFRYKTIINVYTLVND